VYRSDLIIIIPAFNEQETISSVVKLACTYGDVIVVDDGSIDDTGKFSRNSGAVVISKITNEGYDLALDSGFKSIKNNEKYKIIITIDSDGQHPIEMIPDFIKKIEKGYSVVGGSRDVKGRFSERLFGCYSNFKYGIEDPLCGMKAYDATKVNASLWGGFKGSIGTSLLFNLVKEGSYCEIKIPISKRMDSPRFGGGFSANIKIIKALYLIIITKV
jgi:glycosyltransferase involved in cell wall biosynthesis